jgi:galactonate dehydratase
MKIGCANIYLVAASKLHPVIVSTAASLQIAANIPNFVTQEIYPSFPERPDYVQVLQDSPEDRIRDGFLPVPSGQGLGATLDAERLAPFLWSRCEA